LPLLVKLVELVTLPLVVLVLLAVAVLVDVLKLCVEVNGRVTKYAGAEDEDTLSATTAADDDAAELAVLAVLAVVAVLVVFPTTVVARV
jgi:hypothetical protein